MYSSYALDLLIDFALIVGFGVQHSIIAMVRLKNVIQRVTGIDPIAWRGVQSFINVSYLLMACILWREVPIVIWDLQGVWYWVAGGVLVASWVWYFQIHLFEYDCGLAFGSSAVLARLHNAKPPPMEMWKVGTRRWLRFPVHTAFFPMFFAFPRMTASMLLLAVVANIANIIGTVLYDRRLLFLVKDVYRDYQRVTGLLLPPILRAPGGAKDMSFPKPWHWSRLGHNLPGLVMGLLMGTLFWKGLGPTSLVTEELVRSWVSAFAVALVGGAVVGMIHAARGGALELGYPRLLTMLATNTALMSAVSLLTWTGLCFATQGTLPLLYIFFPMWMTMLWLGHFTASTVFFGLRPSLVPGPAAMAPATADIKAAH
ncbi:hypothetical protein HPC49_26100 [Pyxidicoccus fallax]|uniref:Methanethiol S-methyltransferase n=1 Tax=Pyxidicoccus fallax TaxID=394095 RepID=A0A848LL84_9BACT|nr:hypothetical protein [Pyxidicoccus fallax]NMO18469.1 hypothetical protein [Pyxidicoccus fallax]NPC81680.1 hypothetical protein [Pyxidicoccus fallax]